MDTHMQNYRPRIRSSDKSANPYESVPLEEIHYASTLGRPGLGSFSQSSDFAPARKNRPRSWSWHILSHVVSFTWVVPIIALLTLNYKNFIIGPSAWCPAGHCASQIWDNNGTIWDNDTSVVQALNFDKADHNVLGVLQLLAKALEVWFVLLATALIYDLTMMIAKTEGGLPIGLLLTHVEYTDIRNLLNFSLWTWSKPPPETSKYQRRNRFRLFLFALLAAVLTLLTNLMGPASAVLIVPTIQWIDTEPVFAHSYAYLDAPHGDLALDGCNASALSAGNFSCAYDSYGKILDQRALKNLLTSSQQDRSSDIDLLDFNVDAAGLTFLLNLTGSSTDIALAPNREVIGFMAADLVDMANPKNDSNNNATASWLRKSLSLVMKQRGPSIGFLGECFLGNLTKLEVANNKEVWCFDGWDVDYATSKLEYTKCFRTGKGFNAANNQTSFLIQNTTAKSDSIGTAVDLIFSDRAVYFNSSTDFDSGISACIDSDDPANCDWDKIFSTPLPQDLCDNTDICRMSSNLTLVSYSLPSSHVDSSDRSKRLYCDHVSYLSFPTYSFEPSQSTNPTQIGYMTGGDSGVKDTHTLMIDPNWILAAWSVDKNGTIGRDRQIAQGVTNTLPAVFQNSSDAGLQFSTFHIHTLLHALSMVRWSYYDPDPGETDCPLDPSTAEGYHCLQKWATRRVWAYGIGSRTSKLGASVAILGIFIAVFRLYLGVFHPNREHTLLGLFIAALKHRSKSEFDREGMREAGERMVGKVRYRIVDDEGQRPRFLPEQYRIGSGGLEGDWSLYQRRLRP